MMNLTRAVSTEDTLCDHRSLLYLTNRPATALPLVSLHQQPQVWPAPRLFKKVKNTHKVPASKL